MKTSSIQIFVGELQPIGPSPLSTPLK